MGTKTRKVWTRTRVKDAVVDSFLHLFVILVSLSCVLPFLHVLSKSISDEKYVITKSVVLIPKGINFDAYSKILADASIIRSLYISIIVTLLFTALGIVLTLCAAYPLSRPNLKGRKALTFIFMFTLYFSGGIIPEYLLMYNLGLLDKLVVLILPLAFSAYNFLIMKTALQSSIPESLIESAVIDGASHFTILTRLVIPLSKPIIATLSLFYMVGRWNTYMDAMFYIKQRVDLRPLQLKLYYLIIAATEAFQSQATDVGVRYTDPEVLKASTIMFATIPIICIYPFLQKYFVKGALIGSVKG